jgi:hypothetical protein
LPSVTYRKAPPDMRGTFQFVDHCDGVILNRNLALTGDVYQNLIVSQAKLSRPLHWLQFPLWGSDRTIQFPVLSAVAPEHLSSAENQTLPSSGDLGYRRRGLQV